MEKTLKKAIVYNTEEEEKNMKNCVLTSDNTRACPMILFVLI